MLSSPTPPTNLRGDLDGSTSIGYSTSLSRGDGYESKTEEKGEETTRHFNSSSSPSSEGVHHTLNQYGSTISPPIAFVSNYLASLRSKSVPDALQRFIVHQERMRFLNLGAGGTIYSFSRSIFSCSFSLISAFGIDFSIL